MDFRSWVKINLPMGQTGMYKDENRLQTCYLIQEASVGGEN